MSQYSRLQQELKELRNITSARALMIWDQEVIMPSGGAQMRAVQSAYLSGLIHQRSIEIYQQYLPRIEEDEWDQLSEWDHRNLRLIRKDFEKSIKLPVEFIRELSQVGSEAQQLWVEAREKSDFSIYRDKLARLVELKRQQSDLVGYEENRYDALLDDYEPDMKTSTVKKVFEDFKPELQALLQALQAAKPQDDGFLDQEVDENKQWDFGIEVLGAMGFDLKYGRQDRSVHPFTLALHPQDVRITTRLDLRDIREMLYSSMHEGGHGIYEQGLPMEHQGLPASDACSLSIHESQSRLWENNVGRSLKFWEHYFPVLAPLYPDQLKGKGPQDLFAAVNQVRPSPIRISADELTYHFHIMIRFELELALVNKEIEVDDLPSLWNEKMDHYLGVKVQNDREGVLQDIHWSHGNFGYFPTYSLGSFYAAQFMEQAAKELPLDEQFQTGNFHPLKDWLKDKIHSKGKLYTAEELCEQVTGERLNAKYFIDYAKKKYAQVYPGIDLS